MTQGVLPHAVQLGNVPDVHPGVAAGEGEVVEGLRVAAAVLVGQQHAVIPQDEIVQEAVEVDHGHVAEGVIAALSRAAGEGLVVIAPLVGHEIQDAAGRGGPLALQLAGVRHLVLILRHGRGGGLPTCTAAKIPTISSSASTAASQSVFLMKQPPQSASVSMNSPRTVFQYQT